MTRSMSSPGHSTAVKPLEQRCCYLLSTLNNSVTCGPFVSGTDPDFEGFSLLNSANSALSKHTSVEEGIARSIRECDEPNPLSGLNHLTTPLTAGLFM
jgi:hypothetical protein